MKVPPCQQSVSAAVWVYSISLLAAVLTSSVVRQTSGPSVLLTLGMGILARCCFIHSASVTVLLLGLLSERPDLVQPCAKVRIHWCSAMADQELSF